MSVSVSVLGGWFPNAWAMQICNVDGVMFPLLAVAVYQEAGALIENVIADDDELDTWTETHCPPPDGGMVTEVELTCSVCASAAIGSTNGRSRAILRKSLLAASIMVLGKLMIQQSFAGKTDFKILYFPGKTQLRTRLLSSYCTYRDFVQCRKPLT